MSELSGSEKGDRFFVIAAPSGAGKTSLVRRLLAAEAAMGVAVSHTTRALRPGEQDGINYHFVDREAFEKLAEQGGFLEWANVFGNLYGTSIAAAQRVLDEGKRLILEIDWQGAARIREQFPETRSIFIFPPSLTALHERLENRGQDDAQTVRRRMDAALQELSHWKEFDYLIVNDRFEEAVADLLAVVRGRGEALRGPERRKALRRLIAGLLPGEAR